MQRGQVIDTAGIILFLFAFIIMAFFFSYLISQVHQGFLNAYSQGNIPVTNSAYNALNQIDAAGSLPVTLIPLLVIMLAIGSLVLAWYVPTNPGFLILEAIVLLVLELVAAIFSNILYAFISIPTIAYIGNNNPYTVAIVVHFPLIIGIIAILIMIIQGIRGSYVIPEQTISGPLR